MLPFPIISNRNVNPSPVTVKKFVASVGAHQALLYSNGELYTKGVGSGYKLGTGTQTDSLSSWNLVLTAVANVYVNSTCTVAIMNDGTMKIVGTIAAVTGTNVAAKQTWFDITSTYSTVGVTNIKDMQIGQNSALILSNSNVLYKIGLNSNSELGSSGAVTTLTQITTNVQCCSLAYLTSFYCTTAGAIYKCGINTSGQLGNGNTTNTTTFVLLSAASVPAMTNVKITAGQDTTLIMGTNSSSTQVLYTTGARVYGQAGSGTTSSTAQSSFSQITSATGKILDIATASTQNNTILQTDGMFAFGYNNTGSSATGDAVNYNVPTACTGLPAISSYSNILFLSKITFRATFFVYLNQLWGAGYMDDLMGTSMNTFIKIPTPYN